MAVIRRRAARDIQTRIKRATTEGRVAADRATGELMAINALAGATVAAAAPIELRGTRIGTNVVVRTVNR